ncbi:HVA22-like protein [Quillaja saponaria]|uniref:HVA22-like protein n=1 Tax=Quillaja saponaria TaxID=32244 RepID=A0AAD7LGU1_QUISA|nr:HVA22-like protein [Quillaja saponaria]
MIGSFLTRALVMVFGYAYPAYECYKTVEKNKPEIEKLRFWCQYWILVAVLTVCERIGDAFISWLPMYSEAKLAFFIYLWYPKTKGTTYVYNSFFRPYIEKHETEIDRNLLELRTMAGDAAVSYWQRASSYGQTRIYEILQYVASQSTPMPRPSQPRQGARSHQRPAADRQTTAATQPQTEEPPSPTSSTSSSQHQKEVSEEVGPSQVYKVISPVVALTTQKSNAASETTSQSILLEADPEPEPEPEPMATEEEHDSSSSAIENGNPPPRETIMEESIKVPRGRSRKTRSEGTR